METTIVQSDSIRMLKREMAQDLLRIDFTPTAAAKIEALHRKLDLLLYHVTLKPSVDLDPPARAAVAVRRCTICNTSALPLYNIGASANGGSKGAHWRCLAHIPPEMTFPIGLWGADWEASGRKPLASKAER